MTDEAFALPTGEEANRLLAGLARLIRVRGVETFVAAPLLLPESRFFPDTVGPRAQGVAVLLRRLLAYAGLEPKRLIVELYSSSRDPQLVQEDGHDHAAAWFMDIADGVYRFGVRETELGDELALIGTLGHEVAHAYRAHHQLVVPSRDVEEQLTDLTTVYLGFGVFTLSSSYQFRTGHYDERGQQLLYERQQRGYLRPGQLAYLLAAQLVARRLREDLLEPALASLSENHRTAVKRAAAELQEEEAALLHDLALPPVADWPSAHTLDDTLVPLPDAAVIIRDRAQSTREQFQTSRVGFRIAGSRSVAGFSVGLVVGSSVALAADLEVLFWPCLFAFCAVGTWAGRRRAAPACTGCGRTVKVGVTKCAFCGLALVGDIETKLDFFEAEERYRAAERERIAKARRAEAGSARHCCPRCRWAPTASSRWTCTCGHRWNTFETRGRCPDCEKVWETTWCLQCAQPSPHTEWYRGEPVLL